MDGILGDMVKVIFAGGVGYLVATVTERSKAKRARRDSLRQAYGKWLAAQATLDHQLNVVVDFLERARRRPPSPSTGHDSIVDAGIDLDSNIRSLLTVLQEAYLLETQPAIRRVLEKLTRSGRDLSQSVSDSVRHFHMHTSTLHSQLVVLDELDGHIVVLEKYVDADDDPESAETLQKSKDTIGQMRVDLTEWDVSCGVLNEKGIANLRQSIATHREAIGELRSILADQNV